MIIVNFQTLEKGLEIRGEFEVLNYESIVPLYEQMAMQLREAILVGKYQAYKRIPTEQELAQEYQVSRITVRKAVSELVAQGLVEKWQGKGTFVKSCGNGWQKYKNCLSLYEVCRQRSQTTYAKVLQAGVIVAPRQEINLALGLPEGEPIVAIYRVRYIDGKPCVIEKSYHPTTYCFLLGEDLARRSIYELLKKEKQVGIIEGEMEADIIRADQEAATLLEVALNTPLIHITFRNYCADGGILHVCDRIGYPEGMSFVVR
ncbi:MAG: GntR family transcriptional regulator [Eubacterium sp.]